MIHSVPFHLSSHALRIHVQAGFLIKSKGSRSEMSVNDVHRDFLQHREKDSENTQITVSKTILGI